MKTLAVILWRLAGRHLRAKVCQSLRHQIPALFWLSPQLRLLLFLRRPKRALWAFLLTHSVRLSGKFLLRFLKS